MKNITISLLALICLPLLFTSCDDDKTKGGGGGTITEVSADPANPLGDKIFYEIFVRSFADSDGDGIGDLNGITDKLDYIEAIGAQGIWLMPINPSPSYHGYDVTDFTDINPDYGTLEDFDRLVSEAKSRGIDIVIDFVINHSSQEHPWFKNAMSATDAQYRDYYTFEKKTDVEAKCEAGEIPMVDDNYYNAGAWRNVWGVTNTTDYQYIGMFDGSMPDFNYGKSPNLNPVYDEILDAARFWMDRGIAGLRLDAIKHIYQNENGAENRIFLKKFYDDLNAEYPGIYMVGEVLSSTDAIAPFFSAIPSLFHFDAWWKLEGAMMQWGAQYYAKDMAEFYNKFKVYNKTFNAATKLSNHDEDRAISKLGGSVERAKVAAMAIMTTPGQPYIYYGEELGMSNLKSNGDEHVREPMLWGDEYTTTWRENTAPTATVKEQLSDGGSLLNFYRSATKLRNSVPALQHGTFTPVPWSELPHNFMAWYRSLGTTRVYVLMNGGSQTLEHTLNYDVNDAEVLFKEGAASYTASSSSFKVTLPPYSILILEKEF